MAAAVILGRGALGLVLAAALLAATGSPAVAQQEGRPAVGGGSFADAPLLAPGTYRDSLLPAEQLYYAIELRAGQRLQVQATTDFPEDELWRVVSNIQGLVFSPVRDRFCCVLTPVEAPAIDRSSPQIDITTEQVLPLNQFATPSSLSREYTGPGTYYVAFNALYGFRGPPPRVEIPITFTLSVQGTPNPGPPIEIAPTAGGAPARPTSPSPPADPAPEGDRALTLVTGGVIFAILGLLTGGGLRYALRRTRTPPAP